MNILVLNASPKGPNSISVQTALYLEKKFPDHSYTFFAVGQRIKSYEKDFNEIINAVKVADFVLFTYPVYTFLAPYQLHRFIELLKEHNVSFQGKYVSQISTSKHFYDTTAHKYIEENCYDLGGFYIRGLSADMDDLLSKEGQLQATCYFDKVMFDIEHKIYQYKEPIATPYVPCSYTSISQSIEKSMEKDVVIVTNVATDDQNLQEMIQEFIAQCPAKVRVINIREFPFSGGCLGCFNCSTTGKCIYKDGFDDYLRNEIQIADAMIYAYTIKDHYTHSSFKCYDDRQFCNGHRCVTHGMPVGYIISGDYSHESNVQTLVEARSEVGGVYLTGVATDEQDPALQIKQLVDSLTYALSNTISKPSNFYGVGGTKIFRDLVYIMQGMMKADHKFYKKTGVYDFPQKKRMKILQMKFLGALMDIPAVQKKMKGKINTYIVGPYTKIIEEAAK